ncbi:hypothetical protein GGF32_006356 [Allomyces javanicus]|nr:hypothetical protein GGF32_006356 [Allomyces javanicus]
MLTPSTIVLKPIMLGYQLAMVYSLCWPIDQPMQKIDLQMTSKVAQQLAALAQGREDGMLKSIDKTWFHLLQKANPMLQPEFKLTFLLALAERNSSYTENGDTKVGPQVQA